MYFSNSDRAVLLRYNGASSRKSGYSGMNDRNVKKTEEQGCWTFLVLSLAIWNVVPFFKTSDSCQPTLRGFSDPYLQNLVAPDYLPTGTARHLIEVCLLQLNCFIKLWPFGLPPHEGLRQMGINYQISFLLSCQKSEQSKLEYRLYNVVDTFINVACYSSDNLRYGISLWAGIAKGIGVNILVALDRYRQNGRRKQWLQSKWGKYFSITFSIKSKFVNRSAGLFALYPLVNCAWNNTSTHILLELYNHSIPFEGRFLFISDMTSKANHQPSRTSQTEDTHQKPHKSAVDSISCGDWVQKITETWNLGECRNVLSECRVWPCQVC